MAKSRVAKSRKVEVLARVVKLGSAWAFEVELIHRQGEIEKKREEFVVEDHPFPTEKEAYDQLKPFVQGVVMKCRDAGYANAYPSPSIEWRRAG